MTQSRRDLAEITLGVACIVGLILGSYWILLPFAGATIWAAMITIATWPVMLRLQSRFGNRRWAAVLVMVVAILLILVIPLGLAVVTIAQYAGTISELATRLAASGLPAAPGWVAGIPLVGAKLSAAWSDLSASGGAGLVARLQPYADDVAKWVLAEVGTVGGTLLQFLLTVVIAAIMYASGEAAAGGVEAFARRLAPDTGGRMVRLAGQAIRGVALGVVGTALAQSVVAGIGLLVSGAPFAGLLIAIVFMLCIVQLGPWFVLIPAVAWMYWTGDSGHATILLVFTIVSGTMDNVLRPFLIKKGADLPLLLIFAGVIGGLVSFGLLGIFIGPVVLAVTYRLLETWVADGPTAEEPSAGRPAP